MSQLWGRVPTRLPSGRTAIEFRTTASQGDVTYLVNFPDGSRAMHTDLVGFSPPGTVGVHDPWIVTCVERLDCVVDGQSVRFEVWVKRAQFGASIVGAGDGRSASNWTDHRDAPTPRLTFMLQDVRVTRWDAWWVVGRLRCVGRADETTAANAIDQALTDRADGVTLTAIECDAVLNALADPPDGLLSLRSELARNRSDQSRA